MRNRRKLLTFLLVFSLLASSFSSMLAKPVNAQTEGPELQDSRVYVVRVYYANEKDIQKLIPFDLFEFNDKVDKYVLVAATQWEIERIKALGFKVVVDDERSADLALGYGNQIQTIPGYSCYRTVEETFATAANLAATYPTLAQWIDIGNSWEKSVGQPDGYDMMVLKLTNSQITESKPKIFIIAGIHAREYTTSETATRFAEYLLSNYGTDADVTWLVDYHEIHILFYTNPDGRKEAEAGLSWRKNTNENYCGVTSTSRGADLNRNFSYQWGGAGSSSNTCDATYRGPSANSEPETQAVVSYILANFPDQRGTGAAPADTTGVFIDLHSYGGYVLWPWSYTTSAAPNATQLATFGRKIAYFNSYLPGQTGPDLYTCSGVTTDFAYGELGIPAYTIEMGTAFFQTCSTYESTIHPANLQALIYAAKVARTPYMTPLGPDSLNLALSASTVPAGTPVTLTAQANDTRYRQTNGTEPTQNIAAAQYTVDTPPWASGAAPVAMSASDGSFNATTENITGVINTSGLSAGRHTIYVRSKDANNNWGAVSAIFLTIEGVANLPPVVSGIPDQTVSEGSSFTTINLDDYVSDPDNSDDQLTWIVSGNSALSVSISNRVAVITAPNADWNGSETITFRATDPGGLYSQDAAVFTVTAINDAPVVTDIPDQTIQEGAAFLAIPLDNYVSDVDDSDAQMTWTASGNSALNVSIVNRVATITSPNPEWNGSETITFRAADPGGLSAQDSAVFTITAVNDAPVVANIPDQTIPEGSSFANIPLDDYVSDPDNTDPELIWTFSGNTNLIVSITTDRVAQVTLPTPDWVGSEIVTFRAADPAGLHSEDQVLFAVTAGNKAPVVSDIPDQSVPEGGSFASIYLDDFVSDVDNSDAEMVWDVRGNSQLTVTISNRVATIAIPNADWSGAETFIFRATDPGGLSAEDAAVFTVSAVNDSPVMTDIPDQSILVGGAFAAISLDDYVLDIDNQDVELTWSVNGANHLTVSITDRVATVIPQTGWTGEETLTFRTTDPEGLFAEDAAKFTVRAANQAPVVSDIPDQTIDEGGAFAAINLDEYVADPDNADAELAWSFSGNSALSVSIANRVATITAPSASWYGRETITFRATDPEGLFSEDTAVFLVNAVNYLPVVFAQELTTQAGTPLEILLTGTDADEDPLSFSITSAPSNGTLAAGASSAEWVYTPADGFTGVDSFAFRASDGQGYSEPAVISITVTPAGPVQVFWDDFETDLGWVRNANGTDTATLGYFERANPEDNVYNGNKQLGTTVSGSYDLVTGPLLGSSAGAYDLDGGKTSMQSPAIVLPSGRELTLSFSYYLAHYTNSSTDDFLRVYVVGSSSVKVFEELGAANNDDAVWASFSGDISSFAGQTVRISIEAADAGTASLVEAAVDDVLILATAPNNPPSADPQTLSTAEDTALPITLTGSDPESSPLSFTVTVNPAHGSLSGSAPALTYTPAANFNGSDSFGFTVSDGKMTSAEAVVSLTVTPVNDAPVALARSVSTSVDTPVAVVLSGTDVDGDSLTYTVLTAPAHGALTGTAPSLTYTPASGYTGADSFTYKVNDGTADSTAATVAITINPAGPTTIFADDFETDKGWTFNPNGTDTATIGAFVRANPDATTYYGNKQLGTTTSGSYDLVTGPLAGSSASSYDLDGGTTSVRSPLITLPAGRTITLTLRYYLAHYSNSSSSDYLRVQIIGATTVTALQEVGARNDDDAVWATLTYDLSSFAGQSIYILITAADAPSDSLVEAAIDDVQIIAQ
ncbi:MAG TPA: Ig-like domain-containing protein [Anaerolineaceae bacterium]|jgi:hypothetical protein|nr:Ig-like domain-containing protein [Anaerolineaceae bacterium]